MLAAALGRSGRRACGGVPPMTLIARCAGRDLVGAALRSGANHAQRSPQAVVGMALETTFPLRVSARPLASGVRVSRWASASQSKPQGGGGSGGGSARGGGGGDGDGGGGAGPVATPADTGKVPATSAADAKALAGDATKDAREGKIDAFAPGLSAWQRMKLMYREGRDMSNRLWLGTKELYARAQAVREIDARVASGGAPRTRREFVEARELQEDLRSMIPFSMILLIPGPAAFYIAATMKYLPAVVPHVFRSEADHATIFTIERRERAIGARNLRSYFPAWALDPAYRAGPDDFAVVLARIDATEASIDAARNIDNDSDGGAVVVGRGAGLGFFGFGGF
jgi:hypothetical protein